MRTLLLGMLLCSACVPALFSTGEDETQEAWVAPENSWEVNTPPEDLVEEGFLPGDVLPDCRLPDQFADTVSLWQFYGHVLVVDVSTSWCGPCQELAEDTEETYNDYKPQDFTYVTILAENATRGDPSHEDVNVWVDNFGISAPVLGDPGQACTAAALAEYGEYPVVLLIDREMRVREKVSPISDAALRAAIDTVLAE